MYVGLEQSVGVLYGSFCSISVQFQCLTHCRGLLRYLVSFFFFNIFKHLEEVFSKGSKQCSAPCGFFRSLRRTFSSTLWA